MIIYADILFAINFSMDFLSLFICSMILHKKIGRKRIILASLLGALYGVLDVIYINNHIFSIVLCIVVSILICIIVFYSKSIKGMVLAFLMYWGVSAGLGGVMSLLYSFLNKIFYKFLEAYPQKSLYNGTRFFIIASITAIVSMIFSRIFTSKKDIKSASMVVTIDKEEYNIDALCDSGNVLTEPISGKAVVLVTLNSRLGKLIHNKDDKNKRFIPYKDVGGKGLLKGIVPEKIFVNKNYVDAVIAPVDKKDFAGYDALIPISLV